MNLLKSGKLMTRIIRIKDDANSSAKLLHNTGNVDMTFPELSKWAAARFSEISSALKEIEDDYQALVRGENDEMDS